MYVILVNDDNTLSAPKKERIIQRSKLVDKFWFLVSPYYDGHDMTDCTVLLEYLKPTSKRYKSEILVLSEDRYEDYLKYVLPIDTEFTEESGKLELQLSFIYVDIDADGNQIQRVRKTAPPIKVEIVPLSAWSDIIPDAALSALDQRIIVVDSQIKALNDMSNTLNDAKADNLIYDGERLQLTANGNKIGNAVDIKHCDDDCLEDGVPVVDFSKSTDSTTPDGSEDIENNVDNVVEF